MAVPVYFLFAYVFEGILNELIPFVVSLSNALLSKVEGHERNQLVQGLFGASVIDKLLNGSYRA